MKDIQSKKEYQKVYMNCMYRAKKMVVERHDDEYRQIIDELLLEQGIISRNTRRTHNSAIVSALREM